MVRLMARLPGADPERMRLHATELVSMTPDVVLVHGARAVLAVQRQSPNVPIVFASIPDPVDIGIVESLARPGGNVTGFATFVSAPTAKLLEELKEIAPRCARVAFISSPEFPGLATQQKAFEAAAVALSMQPSLVLVRTPADIERAVASFAREPNGGLLMSNDVVIEPHRKLVAALAASHGLPSVAQYRSFVTAGGLMTYGATLGRHR